MTGNMHIYLFVDTVNCNNKYKILCNLLFKKLHFIESFMLDPRQLYHHTGWDICWGVYALSYYILNIEISSYLKNLFKKTHNCTSIFSIDDVQKAITYNFKELEELSLEEKKIFLMEGRPTIMEWVFFKSKYPILPLRRFVW